MFAVRKHRMKSKEFPEKLLLSWFVSSTAILCARDETYAIGKSLDIRGDGSGFDGSTHDGAGDAGT